MNAGIIPTSSAGAAPVSRARESVLRLREPLALEHGGSLADATIAWELHGHAGPVVIALGGISAGRHIAAHAANPEPGWWQPFVGPGRALDTRRFRVLSIDWLGGPGGSSGPRAGRAFPPIGTRDQAAAVARVLDHLGARRALAFVGASYGGMVALAFAEGWPGHAERIVAIGAAHRAHPMATAVRTVQRRVVRLGIEAGRAHDALRIARALAMTTYRTAEEFDARFDHTGGVEDGRARFPVEPYLERCGDAFAERFTADSFLRLSESIDLHDVAPERILAPTTVVSVRGDAIVPSWQATELVRRLGGRSRHIEVESVFGHDAFLKEVDVLSDVLRDALDEDLRCARADGGAA